MYDTGSTDLVLPMRNCTDCGSHTLFQPAGSQTFSRKPNVKVVGEYSTVTPSVWESSPHQDNGSFSVPSFQKCSAICPWTASWGWGWHRSLLMMGFPHSGRGSEYRAEMTVGGVDESKFVGDIVWTDLNRNASILSEAYVVDFVRLDINGRPTGNYSTGIAGGPPAPFTAGLIALDTGTAFLQTPDQQSAEDLYRQISPFITQIDSAGAWGAPCPLLNAVAPELTFTISTDGQTITLPRSFFNLGEYPGQPGISPLSPWRIRREKGAPCGWWDLPYSKHIIPCGMAWTFGWDLPPRWHLSSRWLLNYLDLSILVRLLR
ncbi:hypothetical protein ASPBRDRAFT_59421 [Aspergillus brasiliensis CBS 101740]|uniref:Peptidase A1 domain-containing protein n=1 Tax=Aspergillus brasiliensis (strain CBS 101740 / IMI 381727 / IBT 21946) TaxID=767769 RepID=A0A1L9U5S7_ASPBC|nr:hypothetical protein ASPBRDRAFT_59421 [Aspergillus brasiliensis CBS 101740]